MSAIAIYQQLWQQSTAAPLAPERKARRDNPLPEFLPAMEKREYQSYQNQGITTAISGGKEKRIRRKNHDQQDKSIHGGGPCIMGTRL